MKSIFIILVFTNLLVANTGANLYAKCTGCHGANGEKSALGKSAVIGGQSVKKTISQLIDYKVGSLNLYGLGGVMKGQVVNMSTEDIASLAVYIEKLKKISSVKTNQELSLSLCANEKDDAKRLNCFDKLTEQKNNNTAIYKGELEKKEAPAKITDKGKWYTSIDTSEIDDTKNVILTLSAENAIYSRYRTERPTLYLRCAENKTEAYINWNVFLGSDSIKVLLRYDKEKAKTRRWDTSTDHKSLFVRGNIPFIKKLLKHKKLLVKVTPYSESPVTTTFDVRGLKEAIKPLREACHW